ncbi:hypothetical protein KIW84_UN0119, partial [Lathyrus oleraceus]
LGVIFCDHHLKPSSHTHYIKIITFDKNTHFHCHLLTTVYYCGGPSRNSGGASTELVLGFLSIKVNLFIMEKDNNYSAPPMPPCFNTLDYSLDQQYQQLTKYRVGETSGENNSGMVDNYLPQTQNSGGFYGTTNNSFDKMTFADVMQFADFGPKLALNRQESEIDNDPVYFLKFPVLNNKMEDQNLMLNQDGVGENGDRFKVLDNLRDQEETRVSDENNSVQLVQERNCALVQENSKKRKRPRTVKTSEEVESQRMTHIAVERNRRKQMNEHLRVLRSLMPGSYVQRVCKIYFIQ